MFIEILLLIIAITPYILISLFFNRFRCIINKMSDIEFFLNDTPDQSNKRDELKGLINSGQADKLPGKTPWTCNRVDKATDKVIGKLSAECLKGHIKTQQQGDMNLNLIASRFMGVKNVDELTCDINRNPLITGSITNTLASCSIEGSTSMESIGASVYAKCGNYLGFVALGCEFFLQALYRVGG